MVKRPRGYLSKATRSLKTKRKLTPKDFARQYEVGEKVLIKIQPYYKGAMPHPRYRGRVGRIVEKRGSAYVVEIKDGGKAKKIISHPVHLRRVESASSEKAQAKKGKK